MEFGGRGLSRGEFHENILPLIITFKYSAIPHEKGKLMARYINMYTEKQSYNYIKKDYPKKINKMDKYYTNTLEPENK